LVESNLKTFDKWAPKSKNVARIREKVKDAAENHYNTIFKSARAYRTQEFSEQILDMVEFLPKDELAHLADSLVALTSLHRRVSRDMETVGRAIDVAVISKSDGFIWIKRKHYFKPELNLHFERNYLRGIKGEPR
jgi:hypothetical protein